MCTTCKDTSRTECETCDGEGLVLTDKPGCDYSDTCPDCDGTGKLRCPDCRCDCDCDDVDHRRCWRIR